MQLTERGKEIRRKVLVLSSANGGYHYGGSFSCVEILLALYDHVMGPDDIFILSKGHSCWPLYVLLRERGLNPKLEGHPHRDPANGIHWTTGSLGHGLPAAVGMAMARKIQGKPGRIYVLMGDGECQEGTTWESILIASHYRLDNLCVIVDVNGIQGSGFCKDILPGVINSLSCIGDLYSVAVSGHDIDRLGFYLTDRDGEGRTTIIFAHAIKGAGVSFMENRPEWHAKWPSPEEYQAAMEELK